MIGFLGFTTGTSASTATAVRTGLMPFLAASSFSLPLMSREDMAMLASPSSRALMPLPEPPPESAICTLGLAAI